MPPEPSHAAAISIETRGFRNLADTTIDLDPSLNVLHGPNGAGKTNLLEAVFFALTGSSFRAGSDRDAIRYGESSARAELALAGPPKARLLASIDRSGDRRHLINGAPSAGPARPLVSVFLPDRLALVKGAPALRRAHLDRFAAALWPARAELRQRFGRALAQRNALVFRIRAGLASDAALETWDLRLAAEGVELVAARAEAVAALERAYADLCAALGLERASIRYRPRFEGDATQFADQLARLRAADLGRGYTGFGPQLDEVELRFGDRPLRRFGSQGQQRIALLGLLLAERDALLSAGRGSPLLLLDDVMSELDPDRRRLLIATIGGQVLLTSTDPDQVPAGAGGVHQIGIKAGAVAPSLAAAA